jgi:hypothetical protein
MKNSAAVLACLAFVAQPDLALAQACKISTLSDFGGVALGTSYAKVPRTFILEDSCDKTQLNPHGVCNWMDPKSGIEYTGSDGKIFRKQIEMTAENISRPLPFGLRATDRIGDVARKLKALKNAPQFDVGADKITSKGCLRTPAVKSFSLEVVFGSDGVLKTILAATPTE